MRNPKGYICQDYFHSERSASQVRRVLWGLTGSFFYSTICMLSKSVLTTWQEWSVQTQEYAWIWLSW